MLKKSLHVLLLFSVFKPVVSLQFIILSKVLEIEIEFLPLVKLTEFQSFSLLSR